MHKISKSGCKYSRLRASSRKEPLSELLNRVLSILKLLFIHLNKGGDKKAPTSSCDLVKRRSLHKVAFFPPFFLVVRSVVLRKENLYIFLLINTTPTGAMILFVSEGGEAAVEDHSRGPPTWSGFVLASCSFALILYLAACKHKDVFLLLWEPVTWSRFSDFHHDISSHSTEWFLFLHFWRQGTPIMIGIIMKS